MPIRKVTEQALFAGDSVARLWPLLDGVIREHGHAINLFIPPPYVIALSVIGKPASGGLLIVHPVTDDIIIPAGGGRSTGKVLFATTSPATFVLNKNGSQFGTMNFAAAATVATFSIASDTSFSRAANDYFSVTAPNPQDATLEDLGLALRGEK